jgi:hypothetical protein
VFAAALMSFVGRTAGKNNYWNWRKVRHIPYGAIHERPEALPSFTRAGAQCPPWQTVQNAINIPFLKSQLPEHLRLYFDLTEKMGKLAAQICQGRPEKITVVMVGKNFEEDLCERKFDVPFSY